MKKVLLALLALSILVLATLACGASAPELKTTADFVEEYGGNAEVYDRLLNLTDCGVLQDEFDIADENKNIGYMQAADQRMREIGCYDETRTNSISANVPTFTETIFTSVPTLHLTVTFLPTLTQPATQIPSQTSEPTATIIFTFATAPASSGGGAVCPCAGDTLNCGDFSTSSSAQACMDYCIAQGAGDIHNLDGNANGQACENS